MPYVTELKFALTRSLRLADVVTLRDLLNSRGFNTKLLDRSEGGIDFSEGQKERKDLRFGNGMTSIGSSGKLNVDTLEFVGPLDFVVRPHVAASPPHHTSNVLWAYLKYGFSDTECARVIECLLHCFDVLPDTVHNRQELRGDSKPELTDVDAESLNIYLGFDAAEAISKWTIACPGWPDAQDERLFPCWKCNEMRPYFSFSHSNRSHYPCINRFGEAGIPETTFYGLLGSFEVGGQFPCCDNCYLALAYRHPTNKEGQCLMASASKRRKL